MATRTFKNQAELQAYLAANPSVAGSVDFGGGRVMNIGSTPAPKPERGLLESIVGGIVDPFVGLGKKTLELGNAGLQGIAGGPGIGDFLSGSDNYKTAILNDEEYQNFKNNPLLDTAKDVVGVGSWFIPGGGLATGALKGAGGAAVKGGLSNLVKQGALQGAAQSFASSDPKNTGEIDPTSIATDAVLGGATGGLFGLAGRGLSKLGKAGQALDEAGNSIKSRNLGVKFDKSTPVDFTLNNAKTAVKQLEEAGMSVDPASLQRLANKNTDEFRNSLANTNAFATFGDGASKDAIQNQLLNKLETDFGLGPELLDSSPSLRANLSNVVRQIDSSGGDVNKLFDLISDPNKLLKDKNIANPDLTNVNKIIEAGRQYARDKIKEAVPEAADYFTKNAPLRELSADAATSLNSANKVPLPFVGGVEVPGSGAAVRGLRSGLGSLFQSAGQGLQNANSILGNMALNPSLATKVGASGVANLPENQSTQPDTSISTQDSLNPSQNISETGMNSQDQAVFDQLTSLAAQQLMQPEKAGGAGLSPAEALKQAPAYLRAYYGVEVPQSAMLSAKQKEAVGKIDSASNTLGTLEELLGQAGLQEAGPLARVSGAARGGLAALGLDEDAAVYDSLRGGFLAQIAKAAGETGVLSDQDIARIQYLLPTLGDSKNEARRKFQEINNLLGSNKQSLVNQ